jgi:hypothetical protein
MRRLSHDEFLSERDRYDAAVAAAPETTPFANGSLWQLAARDTIETPGPFDEHLVVEDGGRWLLFAERDGRRIFYPYEAVWMFGCPLVGEPLDLAGFLREAAEVFVPGPAGFLVGGVAAEGRIDAGLRGLARRWRDWRVFEGTDCMVADLDSDAEAWLARRSARFRKRLLAGRLPDGVRIESADVLPPAQVMERLLSVQRRTRKWREGEDIFLEPCFRAFYERLVADLAACGGLRVLFAVHRDEAGSREGEDLAYVLGGVIGSTYRGLQMGYVESVEALGLGNLLQWRNLRERAAEGVARYDFGMHAPYKERWTDRRERRLAHFFLK